MNKILLAHLKKPPFETRIFDKIGKSLAASGNLRISILGNSIPASSAFQNAGDILLHPIFKSKAHSPHIAADLLRFQAFLYSELPDVVVVCSPELLAQAVIYGLIRKKPVVLDLQENFPLNYSFQAAYRWPWSTLLQLVSSTYLSALVPFVKKVWMAEHVYSEQIRHNRASVIENKIPSFWKSAAPKPIPGKSDYFLFSGYITEESGVLKALDFFLAYQATFPEMGLIIAGYCPSEKLKIVLKRRAEANDGVHLVGLDQWLLSDSILEFLASARAVLMPYTETKANAGKIPTKLFEAASVQIPVVLPIKSQFISAASHLNAAVLEANFFKPELNDFQRIHSFIHSNQKKSSPIEGAQIFGSEKIISDIQELISYS
jgi:glycosyltransferase involved in cell wall biosynthesis